MAAAVIRCTWHSRQSRFTAAKPLPSTLWRWDGEERFKTGEVIGTAYSIGRMSGTEAGYAGAGWLGETSMGSDEADSPLRKSKNKTERLKRSVCGGACC